MSIECDGEGNIPVMDIVNGVNENTSKQEMWVNTIQYKVGNLIFNGSDGFYYQCLVSNTNSQPVLGNTNWIRWSPVNYIETDLTKTIGAGGDYATLAEAMAKVEMYEMVGGATLTFTILSGHVINYPIYAANQNFGELIIETEAGTFEIDVTNTDTSIEYALIVLHNISTITWVGNFNIYGAIPIDSYTDHASVFNFEGSKINFKSDIITVSTGNATRHNHFIIDGLNVSIQSNLTEEVDMNLTGLFGVSLDVSGHFDKLNVDGNADGIIFWGVKANSIILNDVIFRSSVAVQATVAAREQSRVGLRGPLSDFRSSGSAQSTDIVVEAGGQITTFDTNSSILGGMNVTPNTVNAAGIIFA